MADNHLEQLIAEWYDFQGYFVRRGHRVGRRSQGGHEGELDIVAFHPEKQHLVHVEAGSGSESWQKLDAHYSKKFATGRKHIPTLFPGLSIPPETDCIAVFVQASDQRRSRVGDAHAGGHGQVKSLRTLLREITVRLSQLSFQSESIPERYPLLRTVQIMIEYRDDWLKELS